MTKLKSKNKDLLFVVFLAKQTLQTKKPCMSSYRTKVYPETGKPCFTFGLVCGVSCFPGQH